MLGGIRAVLREELQLTENRLANRINGVEESFSAMKEDFRTLEERVDGIERRMEGRLDDLKQGIDNSDSESRSLASLGRTTGQQQRRDERYCKARRSLRLWPLSGDGAKLGESLIDFLKNKLKMGPEAIEEAGGCIMRKVPKSRSATMDGGGIVEFPSIELRDAVRSSAYNLAGDRGSGIRLEIPVHLMNNFRALNQAGYRLKKKHPNCRRNVKFDDETCDVIMEFRIDEESSWKWLRPDQARQLGGGDNRRDVTAADLAELLGGEDGDENEDES